jgi:hypothetical protein
MKGAFMVRATLLLMTALAAAGCGADATPPSGSITQVEVEQLPLEEADDLSVRQLRVDDRPAGLPGRDPR